MNNYLRPLNILKKIEYNGFSATNKDVLEGNYEINI